ncbi:hypothetical protein CBS101457_004977 [Exobasidium rhododendri]|nr:hypothetical protein CBS101457_004977 [Exobasidium rhododendri]
MTASLATVNGATIGMETGSMEKRGLPACQPVVCRGDSRSCDVNAWVELLPATKLTASLTTGFFKGFIRRYSLPVSAWIRTDGTFNIEVDGGVNSSSGGGTSGTTGGKLAIGFNSPGKKTVWYVADGNSKCQSPAGTLKDATLIDSVTIRQYSGVA